MSYHLMKSTQIVVTFQIDSDKEIITLLTLLCQLLISFWQVGRVIYQAGYSLIVLIGDIQEAITFHLKVLSIGFNSLAYGMGVTT